MCLGEYGRFSRQKKAVLSVPPFHTPPPCDGLEVSDDAPKSIVRLRDAIEVRATLIESTSGVVSSREDVAFVNVCNEEVGSRPYGQETQR